MITTIILYAMNLFLSGVVAILPTGHLPTAITTAFQYFLGTVNAFSFIIPVDTLLQAAGVVLVFDGAMGLWYLINWIIRKIPGMQ